MNRQDADVIGGFPIVSPNCLGCDKPLELQNAWMTDGCPCNSKLGVNNTNETRWRLLMQLQQHKAKCCEHLIATLKQINNITEVYTR